MFVSDCLTVNRRGHLEIGGCDTLKLAEEFGTPLYVIDEGAIRENCRNFNRAIDEFYGGDGMVAFASKAFCCKAMCRLAAEENIGLDVCSAGELFTALAADFPARRILFHGNNKTPEELTYAVREGVGRIVVDNIFELELLEQIARSARTRVKVQLRIKPGVEAHTHEFIRTGGIDSKFGFALETGEALEAIHAVRRMEFVELIGLHCHIGSQIFGSDAFELAATTMLGLIVQAKAELGYAIAELNLGGGYGIKYLATDEPMPYADIIKSVAAALKKACKGQGLSMPHIIIEPGRAIVGPAGITLYKVGAVKEIPGIRTYVSVDGGLADNPRPGFYGADYSMVAANKADRPQNKIYTVAGRCCESDTLGEKVRLQSVEVGDILAVLATGAYNYSMASNYNRLPKPAVVFVNKGDARCVVRRETLGSVSRNDL